MRKNPQARRHACRPDLLFTPMYWREIAEKEKDNEVRQGKMRSDKKGKGINWLGVAQYTDYILGYKTSLSK